MCKVLQDFKHDCLCRGFSKRTIETYISNITRYLEYCGQDVNIELLQKFLFHLRNKNLSDSTLNGYFAALNTYTDYRCFEGHIEYNPIPQFRKRYLRIKRKFNSIDRRQLIDVQTMANLVSEPFTMCESIRIKDYLWTMPIRDSAMMICYAKYWIVMV